MSAQINADYDATVQALGGSLSANEVVRLYPANLKDDVASALADLAQCQFYEDFAADPHEANEQIKRARKEAERRDGKSFINRIMRSNEHHELRRERRFDFRLKPRELDILSKNGFVVSSRLQAESFAEQYYRLYSDDMPVYVTADSVLHAWHRSFDAFVVELEEQELRPMLERVLERTIKACHAHHDAASVNGQEVVVKILLEIDLFLAIALGLLRGEESFGLPPNDARVSSLWKLIQAEQLTDLELFSTARQVDFSLFKPRGHYTKTKELMKYFQAMTWLGTVDFRVAGGEDPVADRYQLQCSILLVHLLRMAKSMESVARFDHIITSLVGDGGVGADFMTPMQLDSILAPEVTVYLSEPVTSEAALTELQGTIAARGFGTQAITGGPHIETSAFSPTPTVLPTAFAFLGQRFVWSAFVFSKLVYDQVLHDGHKVIRRLPSAVDVAFALLGNDVAGETIAHRMTATKKDTDFVPFRDGVPYASNLVALRQYLDRTLERQEHADDKNATLSTLWLLALRELSRPSASSASVFQSKAWKMRQMNTQIASFTQLRHDTVLYAKQSFSMGTRCEYPAGYVDPYPPFWARMRQMAMRCASIIQEISTTRGQETTRFRSKGIHFFNEFAETMRQLQEIAECQASKRELTDEQVDFIKTVMEERFGSGGSRYLGWYPSLFYTHREDSGKQDHVVVDVHTDVPSVEHGDPGGILHLGVGDVQLGFFVVDSTMYAGPVFSSYEFVTPINERLNDDEFSKQRDRLRQPQWAYDHFLV